jgi:hypothetical protein
MRGGAVSCGQHWPDFESVLTDSRFLAPAYGWMTLCVTCRPPSGGSFNRVPVAMTSKRISASASDKPANPAMGRQFGRDSVYARCESGRSRGFAGRLTKKRNSKVVARETADKFCHSTWDGKARASVQKKEKQRISPLLSPACTLPQVLCQTAKVIAGG